MGDIQALLTRYWGPDFQLRSRQPEIVTQLVSGQDVLALLPTGEGKSLCFQLAGLALGGVTLVVSPLVALMQDQVQALEHKGLAVAWLHGQLSRQEREQHLQQISRRGGFVYLSPELLQGHQIRGFFKQHPPRLVVIDEAHCISQWGHDFRPAYRRLPDFIQSLPQRPVLGAFTATAPAEIATDIATLLQLENPLTVRGIPLQPHIQLQIQRCWTPQGKWRRLLKALRPKTLIYASSRQETERVSQKLSTQLKQPVLYYHAGCPSPRRKQALENFASTQEIVMVATKAFGMGIDIGDIERVIHWQMPESLSAYVQEVGRAGRNRQLSASGVLLKLWGEAPPAREWEPKIRPDQVQAVLQALASQASLPSLRQRYQLPESSLHQILLPLEQQDLLEHDGEQLRLKAVQARDVFKPIWQHIRNLQKQRRQNLRALENYCRARTCRRVFLYRAFSLEPTQVHCGACDHCQAVS